MQIREQDNDTENRYIYVHHSKTGDTKPVPMLDADVALYKKIKPGLPRAHFFLHENSKSGARKGQKFGEEYFYKWWKRACKNLGIADADFYPEFPNTCNDEIN